MSIKVVMKRSLMLLLMMVVIAITIFTFVNEVQATESNLALNEDRVGYPILSASFTCCADNPWHTVDGIFSLDRWTNYGGNATDWVAIDFGSATTFNQVKLYLYNDGGGVQPPSSYNVQYYNGAAWVDATNQVKTPETPTGALSSTATEAETLNTVIFDTVVANQLRVVFTNGNSYVGIVEFEVFDDSIPPNYTVSFVTYGDSSVADQTVAYSLLASDPGAVTKTGHTFAGWYSDVGLTSAYSFSTPVTGDITLYGGWTPISYTVSFDHNDESDLVIEIVDYNNTVSEPSVPMYVGHTFIGWYSDAEFNNVYSFSTPVIGDTTLYAKWESYIEAVDLVAISEMYQTQTSVDAAYLAVSDLTDSANKEELQSRIVSVQNIIDTSSIEIGDIVRLINGTLQEKDINQDGIFDYVDVQIMLQRISTN